MTKSLLLLSFVILISCGQKTKKQKQELKNRNFTQNNTSKITVDTFEKTNFSVVLIGNEINLLDDKFNKIKDISSYNDQFVTATEISKNFYNTLNNNEECEDFKYVRIKNKDLNGYIDGRKAFVPIKSLQNKSFKIDGNKVSFIVTHSFGKGISDEKGLTFCSENTPVIFSVESEKYYGTILNKNQDNAFPYFEIRNDDGASDEIISLQKIEAKYLLKIKRTYQEGGENLLISIRKNSEGKYLAETLEETKTED
jgi:hypothetical protein